jgi:hypothetical protein
MRFIIIADSIFRVFAFIIVNAERALPKGTLPVV